MKINKQKNLICKYLLADWLDESASMLPTNVRGWADAQPPHIIHAAKPEIRHVQSVFIYDCAFDFNQTCND